jgi:transposase-like protein
MASACSIIMNCAMQIEREQTLKAESHQRTADRQGYANGFKPKTLRTRVGEVHLRIPQTRDYHDEEGRPFYPKTMPGVPWQRCQFHSSQNAMAHVPKIAMRGEVAEDIRRIYNADDRAEADRRLKDMVGRYHKTAPALASWLEENIPEALTVLAFPAAHRKRLRTNNGLERLNKEIKRRTRVATLFPNEASLLRLVSAVLSEISDDWETERSYLNMKAR